MKHKHFMKNSINLKAITAEDPTLDIHLSLSQLQQCLATSEAIVKRMNTSHKLKIEFGKKLIFQK